MQSHGSKRKSGLFRCALPDYNVEGGTGFVPDSPFAIGLAGAIVAAESQVQYVSDDHGNAVAVIIPIDLWREIESERETAYLLKSDEMKKRLLEAQARSGGISLDNARKKLGI